MQKLLKQVGVDPAVAAHNANRALVATSLRALGVTFELVSRYSPELRSELADWEEGRVLSMGVLPDGPAMSIEKTGGRVRFLGMGLREPTVAMLFKNMASAVMTFTGQIGAHTASIQRRVIVHGNITAAMQGMRALSIVQKFLLPTLLLNRTSKNPVRLSGAELLIKARVMAGLGPLLLKTLAR